jgi:hypothetical protein
MKLKEMRKKSYLIMKLLKTCEIKKLSFGIIVISYKPWERLSLGNGLRKKTNGGKKKKTKTGI